MKLLLGRRLAAKLRWPPVLVAMLLAALGATFIMRSLALNPNLPGDLNGDNIVNLTDLSMLISKWNGTDAGVDVNQDGKINLTDLSILLSNWNKTATMSPPVETGMATYYVAPNGNDSNPGTLAAPFATLAKARDTTRSRITTSMTGDVTVYVRGGTYRQTSTLALASQDSGKNGFRINYKAYPGERPVISAGVPVSGWTLHDSIKNIWQANVGTGLVTRGLFVNGKKAVRARNTGNWPSGFSMTSSGITAPNSTMASWGNKNKIEFISDTDSHFYRCRASSISGATITMVQPCWNTVHTDNDDQAFEKVKWYENAYELLDNEGEWYDDESAGVMYYKPRAGENMPTATAIAAGIETVMSGTGVNNVQFSGLTFAYTGFNDPNANTGYAGYQQGHYPTPEGTDEMVPAGIKFTGSKNVVFDHNVITMMDGVGMSFDLGAQAVAITGNVFDTIGNNAINLGNYDKEDPVATLETRNISITNNYIHTVGDGMFNSAGIWGGYVADIRITHNEVYNMPQKGIAIGWGWGADSFTSDNKVQYNFIHDTTRELHDSGAIYMLSPQNGTEINNNYILNDINRSNCLYPDEGSAFQNWHHNVCSQVGQWLHIWIDTIHDNKVQNNYADTATQENAGTNNTVSSNTFIKSGDAWPLAAQDIINAAGLEAAYKDIKNIKLIP